jgi:hypothetical protein
MSQEECDEKIHGFVSGILCIDTFGKSILGSETLRAGRASVPHDYHIKAPISSHLTRLFCV